jgi:glycerol-3-phosphate dehydrogenase
MKPVLWGDGLREAEFTYWIYEGLFGISHMKEKDTKKIDNTILDDINKKKAEKNIKKETNKKKKGK